MAKGDRNPGWPGFFRAFTVLCAIVLLLAQRYLELTAPGSGARQALDVYEGLTLWSVPALFMLWGMFALEVGKPQASASFSLCRDMRRTVRHSVVRMHRQRPGFIMPG